MVIKITGESSFDVVIGGMETPADYVFKTENHKLHSQMEEKTLEKIRKFEDRRIDGMEKSLKKKEKNRVISSFFLPFSTARQFLSNIVR